MESISNFGTWSLLSVLISAGGLWTLYLFGLAVYRLYLSPIAKFPGPKLAALSNWYEFYYDVILHGNFTFHIQDLHQKYGPIIRITPTELHIQDADYHDQLYSRAQRQDRYDYFAGRFGNASDTFSTTNHDLHRRRRAALSPMFSRRRIAEFQPVVREKVDKLCSKIVQYHQDGKVLRLNRAWSAMTADIIAEYAFARSYDQLDSPDFEETFLEALQTVYTTGHFSLHFPILFPILDHLPDWLTLKMKPELVSLLKFRRDFGAQVSQIRQGINEGHKMVGHPTIFKELIDSDLPPEETSNERLGDEAQLVISAGLVTTSWALTVASFHIANKPAIFLKLRKELEAAMPDPALTAVDWLQLERLPYLNGCVHEAVRLSYGVTTRLPRVQPEAELQYQQWTIPRNTPVSMTNVDICHDENIFPDSKSFVPERWIENPRLDRYYVAFGKGSRQCLGINLAHSELYIALATVFRRFTFELYKTDISDVEMAHAYLLPYAKWETEGVRVKVKSVDA